MSDASTEVQHVDTDAEPTTLAQINKAAGIFTDAELRAIETPEDAAKLLASKGQEIVRAGDVLGHGFTLTQETGKAQLAAAGVDVLWLSWRNDTPSERKPGEVYTTAFVLAGPDDHGSYRKLIINDGSQNGIHGQLSARTEAGQTGGLLGRIIREEFDYPNEDGVMVPGGKAYKISEDRD